MNANPGLSAARRALRAFRMLTVLSCLAVVAHGRLHAQSTAAAETTVVQEKANPYGSGVGLEILLTNNGFGLGSYYHRALTSSTSFMAEISVGAGKDEQELKFFRFGTSYIPNKANYLLMMPAQVGFSHRLFRDSIEDNFRPFVQVTGGPTLGWQYPYFDDANGNGKHEDNERTYDSIGAIPRGSFRLGMGGTLAVGAHFGLSKRVTQGVRLGYGFTYFFEPIQLMELDRKPAQQFFGTPTISLIFGKLL